MKAWENDEKLSNWKERYDSHMNPNEQESGARNKEGGERRRRCVIFAAISAASSSLAFSSQLAIPVMLIGANGAAD